MVHYHRAFLALAMLLASAGLISCKPGKSSPSPPPTSPPSSGSPRVSAPPTYNRREATIQEALAKAASHEQAGEHGPAYWSWHTALREVNKKQSPAQWTDVALKLALNCLHADRIAEAEALYRECLRLREEQFGGEAPETCEVLLPFGLALEASTLSAEAAPALRRALAFIEKTRGKNHPDAADCLQGLAQSLRWTGQTKDAEPLLRRALAINESASPNDDARTASTLLHLIECLRAMHCLADAETLLRRYLSLAETVKPLPVDGIGRARTYLGEISHNAGRLTEAETHYREALTGLAPTHPDMRAGHALLYYDLARLLKDTNRNEEALQMMSKALRLTQDSLADRTLSQPPLKDVMNGYRDLLLTATGNFKLTQEEVEGRCWNAFPLAGTNPFVTYHYALLLRDANRIGQAVAYMSKALELTVEAHQLTSPHRVLPLQEVTDACRDLLRKAGNTEAQAEEKIAKILKSSRAK